MMEQVSNLPMRADEKQGEDINFQLLQAIKGLRDDVAQLHKKNEEHVQTKPAIAWKQAIAKLKTSQNARDGCVVSTHVLMDKATEKVPRQAISDISTSGGALMNEPQKPTPRNATPRNATPRNGTPRSAAPQSGLQSATNAVVVQRRCSLAARDGAQLESTMKVEEDEVVIDELDPALLFALERTHLSALNHSFYLMLIATGLMSINETDTVPLYLGAIVYALAIVHAATCYAMHWSRLRALKTPGKILTERGSLWWLGMLWLLAVTVAVIDMTYVFVHPVLKRAKAVEFVE